MHHWTVVTLNASQICLVKKPLHLNENRHGNEKKKNMVADRVHLGEPQVLNLQISRKSAQ